MTLSEYSRRLQDALAQAPNADPGFEAFLLLEQVCGLRRGDISGGERRATPEESAQLEELLTRRLGGEPLQYLLGQWEFYGLPVAVGPGVLIPRPETELLVDRALAEVAGIHSPVVLDLCSGSGCVPIAIAKERPDARVTGVELSGEALGFFAQNIQLNHIENLRAVQGDVLAPGGFTPPDPCHVITSNPPYIRRGELAGLQTEVIHEPAMALDGGEDGLDFYRALPGICLPLLQPGGLLLLEIGEDQGREVAELLTRAGYREVSVQKDYAGLDRIVSGRRAEHD